MSFPEKIDVLDLVINVLNEHERKLDSLVERMETIIEILISYPEFKESLEAYDEKIELLDSHNAVLIVDDDEFLTKTFKMLLEESGLYVETANNGNQALLKASQRNFNLAILDLKLPDINGDELSKKLKQRNKDISVILLSGYHDMIEDLDETQIGNDEVFLKPISPDELLKLTEKLVKKN
jgi:CheY-like chemotaxis protein